MKIHRISRKNIKLTKWDNAISNSLNRRVYALSWYLDVVSQNKWDALVSDDYKYVCPLPFQYKFGIKCYYQPLFTQQLGIFYQEPLNDSIVKAFVKELKCSVYNFNFNTDNYPIKRFAKFNDRPNYVLDIKPEYELMFQSFSKNCKRNIKKARKIDFDIKSVSIADYLNFKADNSPHINKQIIDKLSLLLHECSNRGVLEISAAFQQDQMVSVVCWLSDFDSLVYLQAASNDLGRALAASFYLVDNKLQTVSNSINSIDFEGSMNSGIARFYAGFGAENRPYFNCQSILWRLFSKFN